MPSYECFKEGAKETRVEGLMISMDGKATMEMLYMIGD